MTYIFICYFCIVGILALYGLNAHVMVYLFKRRVKDRLEEDRRLLEQFYRDRNIHDLPVVTSQIPVYNEVNVAERVLEAVAAFEYPQGKHEIQVLDDSTDETTQIIAQKVAALKASGVRIEHLHRYHRQGFKAGALKAGLEKAEGELLAIFDADFVPPPDFLLRTVPFFLLEPELGFVQARWGHLNQHDSLLTRLQAFVMDGQFVVEQSARNWNHLLMGFNGTAGILRKTAILAAGNWQDDTLTEDLDLSYRMQLAGWKARYLNDLVAPAELPPDVSAFKTQQFRWTKGAVQTSLKLLPSVWKSHYPFFTKLQATLHLTHHLVHPLIVFLVAVAPFLIATEQVDFSSVLFGSIGGILFLGSMGPSRLYWTAQKYLSGGWGRQMLFLPLLICLGGGLAISNTQAVCEAMLGKKSEFIRTPKYGKRQKVSYQTAISPLVIIELLFGVWTLIGVYCYIMDRHYFISYIFSLYAIGAFYLGSLSFLYRQRDAQMRQKTLFSSNA